MLDCDVTARRRRGTALLPAPYCDSWRGGRSLADHITTRRAPVPGDLLAKLRLHRWQTRRRRDARDPELARRTPSTPTLSAMMIMW